MLDFTPLLQQPAKVSELTAHLTIDDLRRYTHEMIDVMLSMIADCADAAVTFEPIDPEANDTYAETEAEVHMAWTLGHVIVHATASAELIEPVAALVEGTHRVARNELSVEIRVGSRGEMGVLAGSFNDMTRSVSRLEDELNALLASLEQQVEARTADLRAAQEQLVRTEKLSSLGKLSASVAHEINNPLAGILTFAKLISRTLAEGPPDDARRAVLQRNLGLVEREAQRCSAIVRNLLDFARERPLTVKEVDANAAVEEALSLIANQVSIQGVTIERQLAPLPPVRADYGQLRQAFVNVAMNACEAMGRGGHLRIASRAADGGVELSFADTGPGMPPELVNRIFDPFFTTKPVGEGLGLGLAVSYGIVRELGGQLAAHNTADGAAFVIRLPAVSPPDTLQAGPQEQ